MVEYVPDGHSKQDAAAVELQLPSAQDVHDALPLLGEYVPLGQYQQVSAPAGEYSPGAHVSQVLVVSLQEPAGHCVQLLAPVAEISPGAHAVQVSLFSLQDPAGQGEQMGGPLYTMSRIKPAGQVQLVTTVPTQVA